MKLLIDNALSPKVAAGLRTAGYDAVHVRERGLGASSDERVLQLATEEARVVISADTDFGSLLALRSVSAPSVLLVRGQTHRRAADLVRLLLQVLPLLATDFEKGAVATMRGDRVRVRTLPIRKRQNRQ